MYCITDEQIDFILNDIRRNGVEMEDLQSNLLDHICCIIEQNLKENDDFEAFYRKTIRQFYKNSLREIEEETINLLTFKNFYAMKKTMVVTGAFSVTAFIFGALFKYMYWPGASVLLALGIGTFSLLFLPLMFILKSREANATSQKAVIAVASAVGILFSMAILFIIQHWPGANVLLFSSIGGAAFVLLPVYFFTGIRRPETKLNTIIMSIILVGIIGLQFSLVRLRPSASQAKMITYNYVQNELLLKKMQGATPASKQVADINVICRDLKGIVLQRAMGQSTIPVDYENKPLRENSLGIEFSDNGVGVQLMTSLRDAVNKYNTTAQEPLTHSILQAEPSEVGKLYSNLTLLNSITQLQMQLAVEENTKQVAVK
jgi:hypothetical protein